jgi:type VI secretion system ImpC/EvpB family protein
MNSLAIKQEDQVSEPYARVRRTGITPFPVERLVAEASPRQALDQWLERLQNTEQSPPRHLVAQQLTRAIAKIDDLLNRQVNAILHHPAFQKLEAAWRGLHYLVEQVQDGENVKIRILSVSWKELSRDLDRSLEFDQSQLFRKVYSDEFGTPGGSPFSVLLGDYEIHLQPSSQHPVDDLAALDKIASVAAAAFSPFLAAAHPSLFQLDSLSELELPLNLARTFEQTEYVKWRALREHSDSRFVGLVLPRMLVRQPYGEDSGRVDGFCFKEEVGDPSRKNYLWGNAVFAFGAVLIREFVTSGWLAAIRGFKRGQVDGGLVAGLPVPSWQTDKRGVAPICSTEVLITDTQEKELAELGFIPLCHRPGTNVATFFSNASINKPQEYDTAIATGNARLSALLQYVLCVSRFAHYLKVLNRDKVGSFAGPQDCEDVLSRWLSNYVSGNDNAGPEIKAKYPLREGRVQVKARPDSPGAYTCVIHLRPHFQLDQIITGVKLVTELAAPRA